MAHFGTYFPGGRGLRNVKTGAYQPGVFIVGALDSVLQTSFTNAISREAYYQANSAGVSTIPDFSVLTNLYWRGYIDAAQATQLLAYLGVGMHEGPGVPADTWGTFAYSTFLDRMRPTLDTTTVTDLWRQGRIDDDRYAVYLNRNGVVRPEDRKLLLTQRGTADLSQWDDWYSSGRVERQLYVDRLAREGITDPFQVGLLLQQYARQPLETAIGSWRVGKTDYAAVLEIAALEGYRPLAVEKMVDYDAPMSLAQSLDVAWRSGDTRVDELNAALGDSGLHAPERRQLWVDAQRPLPTPLQAANMARSGAFDEALVARWQLDAGIPQQYRDLCAWSGLNWHPRQLGLGAGASTWPDLGTAYWRESATLLSPDEAIEASIRFRGNLWQRYVAITPGIREFTADDLHAHYRAEGYSPVIADWHRALRVPEVPFRTILRLYYYKPATGPRVRARLVRLGYLPSDVDELFELIDAQREYREGSWRRRKDDQVKEDRYKALEYGYTTGYYSAQQATDALLSFGIAGVDAANVIESWRAKATQAHVTEMLRTMRRGFMGGEFSGTETLAGIAALGIQPVFAAQTLAQWTQARTWTRRAAATGDILRWVATGLLSPAVGSQRLANLGWTAPDIALQLAEAEGRYAKLQAAANAAAQRTAAKAQQALIAANKQHDAAIKANQAALRRLTPLSDLKSWLRDGIASESWTRERLALLGYPDTEIPAILAGWEHGAKQPTSPPLLVTAADEVPVFVPSPPPPPPPTTIQ